MNNASKLAAIILFASWIFANNASAQSSSLLIASPEVELSSMSTKAQTELLRLRSSPETIRVTALHLNTQVFQNTAVSITIDGRSYKFLRQGDTYNTSDGSTIWMGRGDNYATGLFSIKSGQVWGTINGQGGIYQISPLDADTHAFTLIRPPTIRDDAPAPQHLSSEPSKVGLTESESRLASTAAISAAPANPPVRILIAYTSRAVSLWGSLNGLQQQVNLAIAAINSANQLDKVTFQAQLAGMVQVTYTGTLDASHALTAFENMSDVKSAHDSMNADLMVMVDNFPATVEAGASYGINVSAQNAYSVVSAMYMASNYTLAHEVGHLMGADHPQKDTSQNVFLAGHGFWLWVQSGVDSASSWCGHTIMSYAVSQSNGIGVTSTGEAPACLSDPRVAAWSSPTAYVPVYALQDQIMGSAKTNDNASVLNVTGPLVTNFHNTKLSPKTTVPAPPNCATNPRACAVAGPLGG